MSGVVRRKHLREATPERITIDGEVLLSHNHMALLHGLYDRPNGHVGSRTEWVWAAAPYFERFSHGLPEWPLRKSMKTINPAWIAEARRGRFIETTLTERGRAIVERRIPSRIVGFGSYKGLPPRYIPESQRALLEDDVLTRIADYTEAFGIPLMEPGQASATAPRLYAVTTGLDEPFTISGRPEIERRGPRGWHYNWTREKIESGKIPAGFLAAYPDEDPEDLFYYLKEQLAQPEGYISTYCEVYNGRAFLSEKMLDDWMNTLIDYSETDIEPEEAARYLRAQCAPYLALLVAVARESIEWKHPVSGKSLGVVRKIRDGEDSPAILTVSTPAALSCLAHYLGRSGARFHIETRYVSDGSGSSSSSP